MVLQAPRIWKNEAGDCGCGFGGGWEHSFLNVIETTYEQNVSDHTLNEARCKAFTVISNLAFPGEMAQVRVYVSDADGSYACGPRLSRTCNCPAR